MLRVYQSIIDWFVPPLIETDLESHHRSLFAINYTLLTVLYLTGYLIYYIYLDFWNGIFALLAGACFALLYLFQLKYKKL